MDPIARSFINMKHPNNLDNGGKKDDDGLLEEKDSLDLKRIESIEKKENHAAMEREYSSVWEAWSDPAWTDLQRTLLAMEACQICMHPVHGHSFQPVSSSTTSSSSSSLSLWLAWSPPWQKQTAPPQKQAKLPQHERQSSPVCLQCQQPCFPATHGSSRSFFHRKPWNRPSSSSTHTSVASAASLWSSLLLLGSNDSSQQIMQCLACGAWLHRSCSASLVSTFSSSSRRRCPINRQRLQMTPFSLLDAGVPSPTHSTSSARRSATTPVDPLSFSTASIVTDAVETHHADVATNDLHNHPHDPSGNNTGPATTDTAVRDQEAYMTASQSSTLPHRPRQHHQQPSFVQFARALQEHVTAHFHNPLIRPPPPDESEDMESFAQKGGAYQPVPDRDDEEDENDHHKEHHNEHHQPEQDRQQPKEDNDLSSSTVLLIAPSQTLPTLHEKLSSATATLAEDLAKRTENATDNDPTSASSMHPVAKFAHAIKTKVKLPPGVGAAAVAGGVVGGVAGLVIGGPVGAYAGAKVGQWAGVLGVLAEGSVTLGVLVAGAATAGFTAQQLQDQWAEGRQQRRILTLAEAGVSHKLVLVRPNIQIDQAVWNELCAQARKSAPPPPPLGGVPPFWLPPHHPDKVHHDRYRRDRDIVGNAEDELPTPEKILLLVSRILNDKNSLPGHVYRCLIQSFMDRCQHPPPPEPSERPQHQQTEPPSIERLGSSSNQAPSEDLVFVSSSMSLPGSCIDRPTDDPIRPFSRLRRDDAHAVIKHVTAALLEVRPDLGATSALTECTATAVERLVFGRIYPAVMEEIIVETRDRDENLVNLVRSNRHSGRLLVEDAYDTNSFVTFVMSQEYPDDRVSLPALQALETLEQDHSAVDKLSSCVRFLECMVAADAAVAQSDPAEEAGADFLLKRVCEHVVAMIQRQVPIGSSSLEGLSPDDSWIDPGHSSQPNPDDDEGRPLPDQEDEHNNMVVVMGRKEGPTALHAQVMFLEEFARDEHLLRGREGYALVTLQAALHFLTSSADPDDEEDEDEYMPNQSPTTGHKRE